MVYESDFYTVRRPYTRPTITSYSVTGWRPCMSIRGAIAPPGTHSKVRMSILLGELNRIQNRHRPHIAYVPTEDFLCSRPLVDFDDEAKHIRAAADKLIRYCHTNVPHETSRLPIRVITAYDRYAPEGRYVSKYSDVPANIQCMSYYTEPSRATIGRGHLACMSYAGGRGYPRRKHLYSDETRDIGDEIKFRSYYSKNVHPRNDDALLLPTGFASRILLPDRRLLPADEGRALVFQSKLIKPVSSGLSIKKEKPEKKSAPKQKSRAQKIEDVILAEENAKVATTKPAPPREVSPPPAPVSVAEPEPEPEVEPEPIPEPEPEPPKEPTPPPVETKTKPKKEIKKKSSLKTSAPVIEPEPVAVEAPPAEVVPVEEAPVVEEVKAVDEAQPIEPALAPEPVAAPPPPVSAEEVVDEVAEPVEEIAVVESVSEPEAPSAIKTEITEPIEKEEAAVAENPVEESAVTDTPVAEEALQAVESSAEVPEKSEIVNEPTVELEPEQQTEEEATPQQVTEVEKESEPSNPTVEENDNTVTIEQAPDSTETENVETETPSGVAEPQEVVAPAAEPEEVKEEPTVEDPSSRLEGEPEPKISVEETPAETSVQETIESNDESKITEDPQISEVVESPSTDNLPVETTEPVIEEPTTPIAE